ncbi:MAG: YraN family protein [Candidatus Calescibacterium sp.]|nr:YraN family protein [Candidatus Calescibacterium sp.]MCX7972477.1 YraN family protein [bacterium]MDW8195631.1 YraN family protein [Candidatus Calescibacterium sp.]
MNKKGKLYEKIACEYLKNKGYQIIQTNFRSHLGEIDIIAYKDYCVVAVEVKGGKCAFDKIDNKKIRKIISTLELFLMNKKIKFKSTRIDAIFIHSISGKLKLYHIENITL